jgi:cysteine desulfurase/selenocysteine lyase
MSSARSSIAASVGAVQLDVSRLRAQTPGAATVTHLNNAGASMSPAPVVDAVVSHLRREAEIGGYEAHAEAGAVIEAVYASVARLINAQPDEIALVENATRAWDMAFYSIDFKPGDKILTSRSEYASNAIAILQVLRKHGAVVEVVPDGPDGALSTSALKSMIDDRVRLIAVNHVPSQNGLVNPAAQIGTIAREAGVLFLLDACQSVGQLPVDVAEIGCHLLSATGRKFLRGPRGTGFLYVDRTVLEQLEPPFLDDHAAVWTAPDAYRMRPDARRFETWEASYAARIGLGVAVEYALDVGLEAIATRNALLSTRLRTGLTSIPGVLVHDRGSVKSAITTFTVDGSQPVEVRERLATVKINVSVTTSATAMYDMPGRGLEAVVRASPHYYNTETEIDALLTRLEDIRKTPAV